MNIDGKFDEEKWKNVRWLSKELAWSSLSVETRQ
jgi:hypothetical protein